MSRLTRVRNINLVLYGVIAVLVLFNMREIRWAAKYLPRYMRGSIPSSEERKLYWKARRIIRDDPDRLAEARPLLERSISIDPNAEGYYWLGRYYFDAGDDERAAQAFTKYLEIDPVITDTYLYLANIHMRAGRPEEAARILEQGREYFSSHVNRYEPVTDLDVSQKFNRKAERVYKHYQTSVVRLTAELKAVRLSMSDD